MNPRSAACYVVLCLWLAGCGQPPASLPQPAVQGARADEPTVPNPPLATGFGPVKIGILPLTELSTAAGAGQGTKLRVFVMLLDAFGSQVKAPGVLRLELYEYVPRSAQLKGQRLIHWQPDIDLTGPAENNKYWQDYLRAYEFTRDAQASRDKTYILEATWMSPDGKRLLAPYVLKSSP